ncbi:hypothetical protein SAMN05421858_2278 [Haladaptatus litoreus]|uniref:DUF8142 domain-containing protein n=2 Tax=Haladaptatus litoreus TaxID=553468 RepID=A0A1N7A1L4_9EURY|nr:hypothetical protein SAMN05421858_2278 [Haladaptatus litoreus]
MGSSLLDRSDEVDRKRAAKAIAPFLILGLLNLALILWWGMEPLWGFAILPPILFISVIGWIGFKSGFITDHADYREDEADETSSDHNSDDADRAATDQSD